MVVSFGLGLNFLGLGSAWSFAAPRSSRSYVETHFPATIILSSLAAAFLLVILATCVLFLACFFAAPEHVVAPETKPTESNIHLVDPFAAVPMNNFDNFDFFGSFSSHTGSTSSTEPTMQSFMDSGSSSNNQIHKTSVASSKKDGFQVKSGVWADSLSCELIDLNIFGPKKVDLTDVGIVGGL
ncbi:clathrin interactor EPSIN 1 [Tanacetum coccineum]